VIMDVKLPEFVDITPRLAGVVRAYAEIGA
jgi:hypothetical protein